MKGTLFYSPGKKKLNNPYKAKKGVSNTTVFPIKTLFSIEDFSEFFSYFT